MINADTTLTPLTAVQQSLTNFSTAASQVVESATPSSTTKQSTTQSLESSFVQFKKSEQNSLASLKVLSLEDELVGKLLDINA
jgi:hypothetical protein